MSLNISRLKSIVIVLLAVLLVSQTGWLWFINITNLPFLNRREIPDNLGRITYPWRIITLHSTDSKLILSAQYNGLAQSESKLYCDTALRAALQFGDFISAKATEYTELLSEPAYIYEYAFSMPPEVFAAAFRQNTNTLTKRGIVDFRQIIIRPPAAADIFSFADNPPQIKIFFICENGLTYEFSVTEADESFSHFIPGEPPADNPVSALPYVSLSLPELKTNLFLPHSEKTFAYNPLRVTNPYADSYNQRTLDSVHRRLTGFFNNLSVISERSEGAVFTFSDTGTVVKYNDTSRTLEYTQYSVADKIMPGGFIYDYSAAITFISNDRHIINENYLAAYKFEPGESDSYGKHTFYFNYVVGGFPLAMENGWPIEITVEHGVVEKYKKSVFNFFTEDNTLIYTKADAYLFIEEIPAISPDNNPLLNGAWLGYLLEEGISETQTLSLRWFWETTSDTNHVKNNHIVP